MALEEQYDEEVTFIIADLDDPEGQRLANDFSVAYIPAFFYIDTNGEVIAQDSGFLTKERLERRILEILNQE